MQAAALTAGINTRRSEKTRLGKELSGCVVQRVAGYAATACH